MGEKRKKDEKVTPVNLETSAIQEERLEVLEQHEEIVQEDEKETKVMENNTVSETTSNEPKEQNKKVGDFGKHQKKFIWITILGAICIALGIFTYYFHFDKKAMFVRATTQMQDRLEYLYQPLLKHTSEPRKSYTVRGKANLTIKSDVFDMMASQDPTYAMYQTLISNLNKMEHQYTYQVDQDKEEMVLDWNTTLNQSEFFNMTFVNQNKKGYVLLKGIYDYYLDTGKFNLFETMNQSTDVEDQKYLYNFIVDAVKKHLKSDYFIKTKTEVTIDGKKQNVDKISLVLDSHNTSEIMAAVIEDMKADKKANDIMNSLYPEFNSYEPKIQQTKAKETKILVSAYTKGLMSSAVQYDLSIVEWVTDYDDFDYNKAQYNLKEQIMTLRYTVGKNDVIRMLNDEKETFVAEVVKNEDGFTAVMKDGNNRDLGNLQLVTSDKGITYTFSLEDESTLLKIVFDNQYESKDQATSSFSFELSNQGTTLLSINATSSATVQDGTNMNINVDNAVSVDALTKEQEQQIQQNLTNLMMRLFTTQ